MTDEVKQRRTYHTKNTGIDFEKEIAEKRRCPQCKRPSVPETDYINAKTKLPTKLCIRCRTSVLSSIKRYGPSVPKKKRITMKEKLALYEKIISLVAPENIAKILEENELVLPTDFGKCEKVEKAEESEDVECVD